MPKVLMHLLAVCLSGTALALVERAPAEAYDMYYLSVGSAHYQDTTLDFPSAGEVAHEIADTLKLAGAVDGLTLTSKEGAYVTRGNIWGALNQITSKAKAARNPLVVYYFLGHGGTVEKGLYHASVLGHYKPSDLDASDITRSSSIIGTQEIADSLQRQKLPYILILDNCYYRKSVGVLDDIATATTWKIIDLINNAIRLTDPAIVLYAAQPGGVVQALEHPENKRRASGPLARRLLLLLKATFASQQVMTVANFLQQMNDPAFDRESVPGYHSKWIANSESMVLIPAGARSKSLESGR
jgi:hypothetical protein